MNDRHPEAPAPECPPVLQNVSAEVCEIPDMTDIHDKSGKKRKKVDGNRFAARFSHRR